ncbi:secreted protein [Leifsonia xyli subsp. xyli str. CTCB07]|uniref:Secreted protein n=1 Tax=Leifsonia xyli subsp. xyli (strain CTCB07) TaxID=281090 RepID=Q6AFV6_LEIXX|nr:secreted protein [Leifsonia xyli subsp. xyli str. CTCB07]
MTVVISVIVVVITIFVLVTLFRAIRIIPQARAGVVERLGRYHKTLTPGLNVVVPFIDKVRPLIDMREQVVSFPPQPVITEDNLVVSIDTVVYFQVNDARAATYEIANYLGAVEKLTTTTLRNVVGGLNLEEALTSRDNINGQLRVMLDEATGKWGIRVARVELKAIEPPLSIQDSMEKQMRAEGEAKAIETVFGAIHEGNPDNLLAYQYLQTLPKLAEGQANKLWIIPSELTEALKGIGTAFAPKPGGEVSTGAATPPETPVP